MSKDRIAIARSFRKRRGQSGGAAPLRPADVAQLYHLDALYQQGHYGQGESIAFVEFALPSARDDSAFWATSSLDPKLNRSAAATVMPGARSTSSALDETDLDLQYAGALAPGAHLHAYVVDASSRLDAFLPALWGAVRAAAADGSHIVSISLGAGDLDVGGLGPITDPATGQRWSDVGSYAQALDRWLTDQGVFCFVSAGDSGAYAGYPLDTRVQASWPATQSACIAVGGTQLSVVGDTASGEQAWGGQTLDPAAPGYNPSNTLPQASGGGGASSFVPTPGYQSHLGLGLRTTPDVAAFAGPLEIVDRGSRISIWGTSASAPITAAIAALYHQATGNWLTHDTLYRAARDVTHGENTNSQLLLAGLTAFDAAGPGYDRCTGAGVPDAAHLPGL